VLSPIGAQGFILGRGNLQLSPRQYHSEQERIEMLHAIGLERLDDLFQDVAEGVRFPALDLPAAISQPELSAEMRALARRNNDIQDRPFFLGAGIYRPATFDYVLQRGEFYTSYTPYQPEMSRGLLQAMFEYQTMICRLTAMDVSTASHYDGATSFVEAILLSLAADSHRRNKILISSAVYPQWREVAKTYLAGPAAKLLGDDGDAFESGQELVAQIDADTAALVVQSPNFFGQFEDLRKMSAACREAGALLIVRDLWPPARGASSARGGEAPGWRQ